MPSVDTPMSLLLACVGDGEAVRLCLVHLIHGLRDLLHGLLAVLRPALPAHDQFSSFSVFRSAGHGWWCAFRMALSSSTSPRRRPLWSEFSTELIHRHTEWASDSRRSRSQAT